MTPTPVVATPYETGASSSSFDLHSVLVVLRRRWKILVAATILVTLVVIAATLFITPIYSATARMQIQPQQRTALDVNAAVNGAPPDQALVDTELRIMKSRRIAEQVVGRLGLKPVGREKPSQVVDRVLSHLKVAREGETYIADLTYASTNPRQAAEVANAVADAYLVSSVETKADSAAQQSSFLNKRLAQLGAEVQAADAKVAGYRVRAGITTGGGTETVTDQQIGPLSGQLAAAQADAASERSKADQARAQIARGGLEAVSGVLSSPTIADLRRQRTEVVRNQAEINARYGPKHPESIKVQQQLDQIDAQLRQESQRIVSGLDSDARAASAQAGALSSSLSTLKGEQAGNARASVQADTLQRDADAKRAEYNQLAQAAQQSSQQQHLSDPQGRIVERAEPPPKPSFPNRPLFAALGVFAGALAGAALVLVLEALDNRVRTLSDVETVVGAPLIAAVPFLDKAARGKGAVWDAVVDRPMSAHSEAMRTIRSALQLGEGRGGGPAKVVALTSATPDEGKSTCAVSLARIMAMSGDRVLLIDCDLRRNVLSALVTDSAGRPGLVEVLTGRATLDAALTPDRVEGLQLLLPRKASFSARDLFGGQMLKTLLDEARTKFDFIVIDTAPVLAVAEARMVAEAADAVVVVCRWNKTLKPALRAVIDRLEQDGAPVAGVVLSMVDTRAPDVMGAENPAFYYSGYGRYYQN